MGSAIGQMLAMAVGVSLSPIPIIASVLLVSSVGGRAKDLAYVIGCAASTAVIGGVLIAVGVGSGSSDSGGPSTGTSVLKLVVGGLLLAMAARQWRGRPHPDEEPPLPKWMGALDALSVPKAFAAGVVVVGLNPKNLLLIVGGAAAVAGAGASAGEEAIAWALFTVIAIVGVATPVVILLLIGAKLIGDGISGL